MTPVDIELSAFRVQGLNEVYAIGLTDKLVTIHSQQVRAICLARLLTNFVDEKFRSNICIVGGGVSALTLSLELLQHGWTDITILERLPDLLGIQNGCDTRWVHPNIINWPDPGSELKTSETGTLDWDASTASNVTYSIEKEWLKKVGDIIGDQRQGRPETKISVHVGVTYIHASNSPSQTRIEWIRDARVRPLGFNGSRVMNSDIRSHAFVVLATGFGIEGPSNHSYWRNEDYGQMQIDGIQKGYIVAGLGDGAISDLLRLTTKHFRPDRAIEEILQLKLLEKELRAIKSSTQYTGYNLIENLIISSNRKKEVGAWWDQLLKHFASSKREDTKVILYHNSAIGFASAFNTSPASFLSKLFLFLLYKNGAFQYVDMTTCDNEEAVAKIYNIPPENIIKRHGVDRVGIAKKLFSTNLNLTVPEQPYDSCKAYVINSNLALITQAATAILPQSMPVPAPVPPSAIPLLSEVLSAHVIAID